MPYIAGDGVKIENNMISAKISAEADNATGILGGAIYTPATTPTEVKPMLSVTVFPIVENLTVTATKGESVLTGTTDANGVVEFEIPFFGVWTLSAVHEGQTWTSDVVVDSVELKSGMLYLMVPIFGVSWDSSASTVLTRTDGAALFADPVPAVGDGEGSSPFDNIYPWSAMEEYNVIDGQIANKKGQKGFSRTDYDTVVYIPEFYYQVTHDASTSVWNWRICPEAMEGFEKHPGSGRYVGRYNTIAGHYSKSGAVPLRKISRASARTNAMAKGKKWGIYDYASWCAVWMLFLVEFADWDSQTVVGDGVVGTGNGAVSFKATGETDTMGYHTGRAAGINNQVSVQYRGIENPWGNVYEWVDGINVKSSRAYIGTDPYSYTDDANANYVDSGISFFSSGNGYPTILGKSEMFPWAYIPTGRGGSSTTYIPDHVYPSSDALRGFWVGGATVYGKQSGMWGLVFLYPYSQEHDYCGSRLLYHPNL